MDHCLTNFLRSVDVLFVISPHCWDTLVNAAPGCNLTLFHLLFIHFKGNWRFSDGKHLFVFHCFVFVNSIYGCFDIILYLSLWSFAGWVVLKVNWAWHSEWQLELEWNSVGTRLEEPSWNLKHWLFEMGKLMTRLYALPSLNLLVPFLNIVVSSKCSFFLPFDFDINVCTS